MNILTTYTRLRRWVGPCAAWRVAQALAILCGPGARTTLITLAMVVATSAAHLLDGGL